MHVFNLKHLEGFSGMQNYAQRHPRGSKCYFCFHSVAEWTMTRRLLSNLSWRCQKVNLIVPEIGILSVRPETMHGDWPLIGQDHVTLHYPNSN